MLRAFRELPPVVRQRSVLAVAGAGELGDKLRELSNTLGLENNVMWLGMREDVPDLLIAADGVLLSSAWEGMPMILLEAALSGKLVVATDVGGVRDIVIPDQTGFLVQPGDCRGLSKVIEGVMNTSKENRKMIGDAARRYAVEAFTPERIIPVWEGLYESLRRSAGNLV
jgi:glycosyltransferase involved in cell wall biosynthesis